MRYVYLDLRGDLPFPMNYDWRVNGIDTLENYNALVSYMATRIDCRVNRDNNIKLLVLYDGTVIHYRDGYRGPLHAVMERTRFEELLARHNDYLTQLAKDGVIKTEDTRLLTQSRVGLFFELYPELHGFNIKEKNDEQIKLHGLAEDVISKGLRSVQNAETDKSNG